MCKLEFGNIDTPPPLFVSLPSPFHVQPVAMYLPYRMLSVRRCALKSAAAAASRCAYATLF